MNYKLLNMVRFLAHSVYTVLFYQRRHRSCRNIMKATNPPQCLSIPQLSWRQAQQSSRRMMGGR